MDAIIASIIVVPPLDFNASYARIAHNAINASSSAKKGPRWSSKPYKNESDAFNVLQLTLTNAPMSDRFMARTRVISKTIAAITDGRPLKPAYADAIERAIEQLRDASISRYSWSLDTDDGMHSMLLFV